MILLFISFVRPKVLSDWAGKNGMKQLDLQLFFAVKTRSFRGARKPRPKVWF